MPIKSTSAQSIRNSTAFIAALAFLGAASARAQITDLGDLAGTSNGSGPNYGPLVQSGNTLYGVITGGGTYGKGAIFSVPITGGTPTLVSSFNTTNGASPNSSVILSNGVLYGTTTAGGTSGNGVVYSVPVTGGDPTVLANFDRVTNGYYLNAGLLLSGGLLYGETYMGGANNDGVIFSVPVSGGTGTPTVLGTFSGTADGQSPNASLILNNGYLYGTTRNGGTFGSGAVFSMPIGGGAITNLASFASGSPTGALLLNGTTLYGTTSLGGSKNDGNVFSVPLTGGTPTDLGDFNGTNGTMPFGALTLVGSTLYGTASGVLNSSKGVVFSLPIGGGPITDVATFNGTNGQNPYGDLILSNDGTELFGTTKGGGGSGNGTVFAVAVPTPEPGSATLLAGGVLGLAALRRRRTA
jgi:uncharacterized repeat protein (TIGR03803 family)